MTPSWQKIHGPSSSTHAVQRVCTDMLGRCYKVSHADSRNVTADAMTFFLPHCLLSSFRFIGLRCMSSRRSNEGNVKCKVFKQWDLKRFNTTLTSLTASSELEPREDFKEGATRLLLFPTKSFFSCSKNQNRAMRTNLPICKQNDELVRYM